VVLTKFAADFAVRWLLCSANSNFFI